MSLSGFPSLAIYSAVIFGFAAVVTALVLRHLRILDVPNERSSHSAPTPRGGGIAIVGGFFLGLALTYMLGDATQAAVLRAPEFAGILVGILLIAAISLHDDIQARGFSSKLLTQLVAIAVVMGCGLVIDARQLGLGAGWTWLVWPLTLLWMVGLTNAYNFMDGLDGMAGGTGAIASAFFALIVATQAQGAHNAFGPLLAPLAIAICAGACGFLLFNWAPAKIFMGDIGSTFLGFSFAALALLAAHDSGAGSASPVMLFVMPLLLLHFIFDTVFTFCRRALGGENLVQAHRTHLYQLLNRAGWSHRSVSLLYAGMATLQGLGALWMSDAPQDGSRLGMFVPFLVGHAVHAIWVTRKARRLGLIA